jgi:hypothetical protein
MDIFLQLCIHSYLQPKDTRKYDEASSLHVMIKVMIYLSKGWEGNTKGPAGDSKPLPGPWIYK